jgi:carboxypeptidase Taq
MILTKSSKELYGSYCARMQKIADIKNAVAVLEWDQETYLPVKGATFRGRQMATLSATAHEWATDQQLGDLLTELNGRADLQPHEQKNVALSLEDFSKQKKFTPEFIHLLSETTSCAFHAWLKARTENSFTFFEPHLDKLLQLKRQQAGMAGYEHHPYNALLDEFEKGCTVDLLDKTFREVIPPLKDLLDRIASHEQVDDSFLHQHYPRQQQWDFGMELIRQLGFDFEAGRQDISEHPFTTSFCSRDVRITTRIDVNDFNHMTWSCIHETGHALYEQGLKEEYYGLPLGEFASLSIHESQSRLWENNIGRSLRWWEHEYPLLQKYFPVQLGNIPLDRFYKGINKVGPSLIRTEADETSYHFHVMIRYELEKNMIAGLIQAQDVPTRWAEQYEKWLDVKVPDDRRGCLQDVHWSHGMFGYFSTYSLGSFYAAQLFAAASQKETNLLSDVSRGQTAPLLDWLRRNVHCYGRQYTSEELCKLATGEPLNIGYFMRYLLDKYNNIYKFCV